MQLHPQEAQEARVLQRSEASGYRKLAVEHRLARLVQLGIPARYFGRAKTVVPVANLTLVARQIRLG